MSDPIARNLVSIDIQQEMRSSYLDYSMSVIIGRALPDVRDGLKPVHRRIIYAMQREGLHPNRRYSKCAGVVGEVLKKYHPHGDSAVYDALVRMAQPWNMRYLLVDGQGNFGSVDGDPPAAYRYTECRMQRIASELLADIDEDTVDFQANFDGATEEPTVLPAAFPSLLVNGSEGIAVGMATKIPPHNLGEIMDAVFAVSHDPEITDEALMALVPGPDFPTAGTIYGRMGIREAYTTGRGRVVVRGNARYEETDTGGTAIIIDELPYQVNKARLMQEIANLVKNKRVEGIRALRDESDRQGMRVVVELKRDAVREVVLNRLFKHTALQSTFGVILLAIVNRRPKVLTLREMLQHYLDHRRDVTVRRTRFRLQKARERMHTLEGLLIAVDNLDEVIAIIRGSENVEAARASLMERFSLSEDQSQAILSMRLSSLTRMSRLNLETEYAELQAKAKGFEAILGSEQVLMDLIREELTVIREKYADERRTRIIDASGDLSIEDLIADEEQVITLSVNGYVKRCSQSEYQEQRRGGFGKRGMRTRDEDSVKDIFIANTLARMLVFTTQGRMFRLPVYQMPEVKRDARGTPIVNLVQLESDDSIAAVLAVQNFEEPVDLVFCSRQGLIKRTRLSDYRNVRATGIRAYDCADGDALFTVVKARTEQHLLIATKAGKSVRIPGINEKGELEVRHMGRVARGVRGMSLAPGDEIAGLEVLEEDDSLTLLTVTENGYGKRTKLDEYRVQSRGGKGIINIQTDERNGRVAGSLQVHDDDSIMLITDSGRVIKIAVGGIGVIGRNTKGVTLMRVDEDEHVVGVARVVETEDEELEETDEEGTETPAEGGAEVETQAEAEGVGEE